MSSNSVHPNAMKTEGAPLVSIILVTRNRVEYLDRALRSILMAVEKYPNTEIIVIDGGSSDGTPELLKRYSSKLAYWISEPDRSVGEATNKGLARARGEIIHLTADDDEFLPDTISYVARYLIEHPEVDAVSGEAEYLREDADGNFVRLDWPHSRAGRWTLRDVIAQNPDGFPTGLWPEQQFSRRSLFDKLGGFDTSFKYFGYIELFCRQTKAGAVFEHTPKIILRRIFTPKSDIYNQNTRTVDRELTKIMWTYGGLWDVLTLWRRRKLKPVTLWYQVLRLSRPIRHPFRAAQSR